MIPMIAYTFSILIFCNELGISLITVSANIQLIFTGFGYEHRSSRFALTSLFKINLYYISSKNIAQNILLIMFFDYAAVNQ